MCHQKKPVNPRNPRSSWDVVGSGQSMTADILSAFGVIPSAEIVTPPKRTFDWKSLHFAGASDKPFSWHLSKNFLIFASLGMKLLSAIQMSSIQLTSSLLIMLSNATATISQNVVGAPVSPNGILRYTKYPRPST